MSKKRLIDATDLVRRVLEERDKIMSAIPCFEFAVANPERYRQAMHGGLRKALRCIEESPTIDAEPVIRCKDCEEYIPWGDRHICGLIGSYFGNTKPNDFCSRGRRKKAGE